MNRNEWKFRYAADVLLDAASKKKTHHAERLFWWDTKKTAVMEQIKAEGIEVDEGIAASVGNYTSGRGASVNIRNDLVRDLQECAGKVTEHRIKVADYDAWMQVLSSQEKATFELEQDDWLFFFGRQA